LKQLRGTGGCDPDEQKKRQKNFSVPKFFCPLSSLSVWLRLLREALAVSLRQIRIDSGSANLFLRQK
jgi:hypothetical protein